MRSATVLLLLAALLGAAPATAAYAAPSNGRVSKVGLVFKGGHSSGTSHHSSGTSHFGFGTSHHGFGTSHHSYGTGTGSHGKMPWWEAILVLVVFFGFFGYLGYRGIMKVRAFFRRNA
ncbi:hypothetical protein [Streptomyces natalensis]|uniref:Integral membrane protein n=1 Tax=Streptomyces natalensis ATCC 27448 TaxID=1240678 RepID=A0A0D7CSI5_9ACTN|nr:hypothetical protein [Streptomyces natalensis]KIZ19021.1 hypothetical protein SNA_04670 [Streptomyces natalensis ATCC 27448]